MHSYNIISQFGWMPGCSHCIFGPALQLTKLSWESHQLTENSQEYFSTFLVLKAIFGLASQSLIIISGYISLHSKKQATNEL